MRKKRNGFEGGDIKLVKNTAETGITATEEEPGFLEIDWFPT